MNPEDRHPHLREYVDDFDALKRDGENSELFGLRVCHMSRDELLATIALMAKSQRSQRDTFDSLMRAKR